MPVYEYNCKRCGKQEIFKPMSKCSIVEYCKFCNVKLNMIFSSIHISGTRDGFGIRKEFYDPKTKQYINNWKSWEKAGYKNPLETNAPEHIQKLTKEAMKTKSFQHKTPSLNMAEKYL